MPNNMKSLIIIKRLSYIYILMIIIRIIIKAIVVDYMLVR